ncbi:hypothetical protein ScPMuIL_008151 [Solemya velum]
MSESERVRHTTMVPQCPYCRYLYVIEPPVISSPPQESNGLDKLPRQRLPILSEDKLAYKERVYMDHEALHDLQDKIKDTDAREMDRHRYILHDVNRCSHCKMPRDEYEGMWKDLLHDFHSCPYCTNNKPPPETKELVHVQETPKPKGSYMMHDPYQCPACQMRYHDLYHHHHHHEPAPVPVPAPAPAPVLRRVYSQPQPLPCPYHDQQRQIQFLRYPERCPFCEQGGNYSRPGMNMSYGNGNYQFADPYYPDYPDKEENVYGSVASHHVKRHDKKHHKKRY